MHAERRYTWVILQSANASGEAQSLIQTNILQDYILDLYCCRDRRYGRF
jgi:hypothetical protein